MKTVYILLSRTNTLFGRAIRRATGAAYSHAALAIDRDLEQLYSFSRRFSFSMLPAGFQRENVRRGVYSRNAGTACALYALEVEEEVYGRVAGQLQEMYVNRWRYRYNLLGIFGHVLRRPLRRKNHFFCSEFVAEVLRRAGALAPDLESAFVRPDSFCTMEELRCVYTGPLWGCLPQAEQAEIDMPYFYISPLAEG